MNLHSLVLPVVIALSLTACDSGSSEPLRDGSGEPDAQADISTPDFRGFLHFPTVQRVPLEPFLQTAGLSSARNFVISQDGQSIRADVFNDAGDLEGIAKVDTTTEEISWIANDVGNDTHFLFSADNQPVAVYGRRCAPVSYTPIFSNNLIDLATLLPAERCVFEEPQMSADGNVVLFYSYRKYTNPYESNGTIAHAYTFDTAHLTDLSDFNLSVEGNTLTSIYATTPFGYDERILSNNDHQFFFKNWWSDTDENGDATRQVGAVLWDTDTSDWQVLGQSEDFRGCSITENVSCNPPYYYAMSGDGSKQYFSAPTVTSKPLHINGRHFSGNASMALPQGLPT